MQKIEKPIDLVKQPWQWLLRRLGAGLYLALASFHKPRALPGKIDSLLVVRRNRIGDAVITALLLQQLRREHPFISITVLSNSYAAPVFREAVPEAEVLALPDKYLGTPLGLFLHPIVRRLRTRVFDIALNGSAAYSSKAIMLLAAVRAHYKVAIAHKSEPRIWQIALDDCRPMEKSLWEAHQITRVASVFKRAGLPLEMPPKATHIKHPERNLRIGLFPESNRKQSQWPYANWLDLAIHLKDAGHQVKVFLSKKPQAPLPPSLATIHPQGTAALIAEIKTLDHVVCQEGGVSHLAAMLQRPVTVLSGVQIKNTWLPWTDGCGLIERTGQIAEITVREVVEAVHDTGYAQSESGSPPAQAGL